MNIETELYDQGEYSTFEASMITAQSLMNAVGESVAAGNELSVPQAIAAAQAHATIALAEQSQMRLVRIGEHTFNLAHVVYVKHGERIRFYGDEKQLETTIYFDVATESDGMGGPDHLWYTDERAIAVYNFLRPLLQPLIVGEMDLPPKAEEGSDPRDHWDETPAPRD